MQKDYVWIERDQTGKHIKMPKRTYVWRDGKIVELVREEPKARMQIIEDIKPYRNMYDFSMINSRREHREFLKRGD